jgi:predicted SnoaL-like aldol condensation-catalyzing enzyme
VAVVQDGDLVAFVTPKTVAMPPNYFDDNEDVAVD